MTKQRVLFIIVACSIGWMAHADTAQNFFTTTATGNSAELSLDSASETAGQFFHANTVFNQIAVNCYTWGPNTGRGFTMKLFGWAGSWAASVATTPIATQIFSNIADNADVFLTLSKPAAAGDYLVTFSNMTGGACGPYVYTSSGYNNSYAFMNGSPDWAYDNTSGSMTAHSNDPHNFGQRFYLPESEYSRIEYVVYTYSTNPGKAYTAYLYAWNTDYNTTVGQTPLITTSYPSGVADNSTQTINWGARSAGTYLMRMAALSGSPTNAGWWRYTDTNNFNSGQAYLDSGAVAGGYRAKITYNSRDLNGRVIKLTPPKPGVPDLAAADDTGSSNTDNRTNQTSALTISGTAEAGSTVTLWEGYTSKATATADTNGNYSADISLSGNGAHTIVATATDALNQTSPTSDALDIFLDTAAPTGTVTINSGASFVGGLGVTLALSASDTGGSSVVSMQFSNNGSAWSGWETYGTSKSWSLASGADGSRTVYVQYQDTAGNVSSAAISDDIVLDTTGPAGTISINAGASHTAVLAVTLTLTANDGTGSGVTNMQFSNDGAVWSGWQTYGASKSWTLASGADGSRTVYAQYRDALGNISPATISNTIAVDTTGPAGSITINGGASFVGGLGVTLTLSASDAGGAGVADMQFSNDGSAWSGWEGYATSKSWTLAAGADGTRTVYAQFRDAVGNVSTGTISKTIAVDTVKPAGTVSINAGAEYTALPAVSLTMTANDGAGAGVTDMQFSNDGSAWSGWEAYASSKSWTLSSGDGSKTVYLALRDGAGNVSTAAITDSITLDTTGPSGSISINGGAAYTNSTSATLALSASDGGVGVADMRFSNDGSTWSGWQSYGPSAAWTIATGDGPQPVYVQFRDQLLNVSGSAIIDSIVLDTGLPTGSLSINGGAAYAMSANVTLALTYSDALSGVTHMRFSNDGANWSSWFAVQATTGWTLGAGDGLKTVWAEYRDAANNISTGPITNTITEVPPESCPPHA